MKDGGLGVRRVSSLALPAFLASAASTLSQRRRKQFESVRGHMASAEREPIRRSGGGAPSEVHGQAEPLVRGSGGQSPLKLKGF